MADSRHPATAPANDKPQSPGTAFVHEILGISPAVLRGRHADEHDSVAYALAAEVSDAARNLDRIYANFQSDARWIERALSRAREDPSRVNPHGVMQNTGAAVERNAALIEMARVHLEALVGIYKIAVGSSEPAARQERGFDHGRRTAKTPRQSSEARETEPPARPPSRRGVQPVPPVITATPPPTPRGRR